MELPQTAWGLYCAKSMQVVMPQTRATSEAISVENEAALADNMARCELSRWLEENGV
jgi:hypothetical protein